MICRNKMPEGMHVEVSGNSAIVQPESSAGGGIRLPFRELLIALLVIAFFSLGHFADGVQKEQDTIRAKSIRADKFEVRGPDGKVGASLFRGPKDEPMLAFFDSNGRPRMTIGLDQNGNPLISMLSERGRPKLLIALDHVNGSPSIDMLDDVGEPVITLGMTKDLGSGITVGKLGQARLSIDVSGQGVPSFQLFDGKNNPRIAVGLEKETPSIVLKGENGGSRITWRVRADGSPEITLLDRTSKPRLILSVDLNGKPSIRSIDPATNLEKTLE